MARFIHLSGASPRINLEWCRKLQAQGDVGLSGGSSLTAAFPGVAGSGSVDRTRCGCCECRIGHRSTQVTPVATVRLKVERCIASSFLASEVKFRGFAAAISLFGHDRQPDGGRVQPPSQGVLASPTDDGGWAGGRLVFVAQVMVKDVWVRVIRPGVRVAKAIALTPPSVLPSLSYSREPTAES
jgi:hypothetical protein